MTELDSSQLSNPLNEGELRRLGGLVATAASHDDTRAMDEFMKQTALMSEAEKALLIQILEEMRGTNWSESWESVWQVDFERKPVPFEEWLQNPYYMGDLNDNLFPLWKKELAYICHPSNGINEWYVTGSIGGGKTYASLVGQIYRGPYHLSCLRNPQKYYGIATSTMMVFGLFNAILDNASRVNFSLVASFVKNSHYFRDHCPAQVLAREINWPTKNFQMRLGSTEMHALGSNLFGLAIDEVNFMQKPQEKEETDFQAQKLYNAAKSRVLSRFQRHGQTPGLFGVISSKAGQTAFLENLIEDNRHNPNVHVTDVATWETKGRDTYSPVEFRVVVGDRTRQTEILDEIDACGSPNAFDWRVVKSKPVPAGCKYVNVPADYYFRFTRDPEGALRDDAGIATFGKSSLILRRESIPECRDQRVGPDGQPLRTHPFVREWEHLRLKDPNANYLAEQVKWSELRKIIRGTPTPLYFPGEPRFVHVDIAIGQDPSTKHRKKTDSLGIAMGCAFDKYILTDRDPQTGQLFEFFRPKVWIDFMLQIRPIPGEQIDIGKVQTFVLNLKNYGFHLQRVTADGFQSAYFLQEIEKSNLLPSRRKALQGQKWDEIKLETRVISVDKTDEPYKMLRDCLNQNAISYYHYPIFETELQELEHDPDAKGTKPKVDHPPGGSKDVSDAVAGVCYSITTAKQGYDQEPLDGILKSDAEVTVETDMIASLVSGPKAKRIVSIQPPPKQESKHRHLKTRRGDWRAELEQFGRHRRPL